MHLRPLSPFHVRTGALYWAQKYPDEVSAIIGLDMAVPEYYDSMTINIPLMRAAALGGPSRRHSFYTGHFRQ